MIELESIPLCESFSSKRLPSIHRPNSSFYNIPRAPDSGENVFTMFNDSEVENGKGLHLSPTWVFLFTPRLRGQSKSAALFRSAKPHNSYYDQNIQNYFNNGFKKR